MEDRLYKSSFFHKQEDSTGTPPDNAADSCFSGDEAAEVNMPSPRKRFVNLFLDNCRAWTSLYAT